MWDSLASVSGEISHASNEQATYLYAVLPFCSIVSYLYFATKEVLELHFAIFCMAYKKMCS